MTKLAPLNPVINWMANQIEEDIYNDTLTDYDIEDYDEIDIIVELNSVEKREPYSRIVFFNGEHKEEYDTDKPINYWHNMCGKRIHIKGAVVYEGHKEKLIVLKTTIDEENETVSNILTEKEIKKYGSLMNCLSDKQQNILYSMIIKIKSMNLEDKKVEEVVRFISEVELKILYEVIRPVLPINVCAEVERCISEFNMGSTIEKTNCKKVLYYLLNFDWLGNDKYVGISEVQERINKSHIGMNYSKQKLLEELMAYYHSEDKNPEVFLLVGREGCGKTSLAKSFINALGKTCSEFCLAGKTDEMLFNGSSRGYENGRPSELFMKLYEVGCDGGIILDEIDKADTVCLNALQNLIEKRIQDDFLQITLELPKLWVICTANDIKNINPAFLSRLTVINVDEYSNKEKERIINEIIIPKMCKKYKIEQEKRIFSTDVCEKIIGLEAGKSIRAIEKKIRQIFIKAIAREEEWPRVTVDNINDYIDYSDNLENVRRTHAKDYADIERKVSVCNKEYPVSIQKRNAELLELALRGTTEEKEYALSALRILANILTENVEKVDINKLKKTLDESHYGLDKTKEMILRDIAAHSLQKEDSIKAILLDGCPGVGKTSIAKTIAKALHRKFVKISLNGVSSAESIKGFLKTYKGAQPGIIASSLAKAEVGSYSAVVLLDEVDKMIVDGTHDPYTSLHDLLDNNGGLYDQYLRATIKTDNILWILTSNDKSKIPETILDRVEVIDVGGYTAKEKYTITKHYVIPKIAKKYALNEIQIGEEALTILINDYCISNGVRDVEKAIEKIIETVAVQNNLNIGKNVVIDSNMIRNVLGAKIAGYNDFPTRTQLEYGQARALAVSGNYGSVFGIQIVENPYGADDIEVTGLAKGSFAESIRVAKTLTCNKLNKPMPKIHIHILNPGIEKDGPSAGITLFACMMSFMLKKALPNVAFTGTIDLFGNIGVIGGEKLKLAAAEKAGVEKVFIPIENYEMLCANNELSLFSKLDIYPVSHIDEVIEALFEKKQINEVYSNRLGA